MTIGCVIIFNNYKVKDPLLMLVWLYTAAYNINLQVKHIRGQNNVCADMLSHWRVYKDLQIGKFNSRTDICSFTFICTDLSNNCIFLLAKADTGQPNRPKLQI